jgi:hypothetical protein
VDEPVAVLDRAQQLGTHARHIARKRGALLHPNAHLQQPRLQILDQEIDLSRVLLEQ